MNLKNKATLFLGALLFVFSLSTTAIAQSPAAYPVVSSGTDVVQLADRKPIHWVSIEQIKDSLKDQPPMTVGFDIDDTILFSSPGFWRGQNEFGESYLHNPEFWEKMNNDWENFSIPKQSGIDLVKMHLQRGDTVYFITGRDKTKSEHVSAYLQKVLNIPADKMNPVIFAGEVSIEKNTKVEWMRDHHLKLYYGDSDSDITAAEDLNIRGIRVLRASNSTYKPLPKVGIYGEEVVINSEY